MSSIRLVWLTGAALGLAGCVSSERATFSAAGQQQAVVRDGMSALVSRKKNSVVMITPASRNFTNGQRPVYVLAMTNVSKLPLDFRASDVSVIQIEDGRPIGALAVKSYDDLAREERNRQIAAAVLTVVAAGANAYVASNAGYGTARSTVYSGNRATTVNTTFYSPTAAAIAQSNAAAQNDAMISNTIEAGRVNMARLEREVIKDNTVMPGEWYGGQLHFEPPARRDSGSKAYLIEIKVGNETHQISVAHQAVAS